MLPSWCLYPNYGLLPIYLETGGHRPDMILPYLDSVGMDLKLTSVSGENPVACGISQALSPFISGSVYKVIISAIRSS